MPMLFRDREGRLDDVLDIAFSAEGDQLFAWAPKARPFGAAGRRGPRWDSSMAAFLRPLLHSPDADIGRIRAYALDEFIVKSRIRSTGDWTPPSVLARLDRLAAQIVAAALHASAQVIDGQRLLMTARDLMRPPVLLLLSSEVSDIGESRIISQDVDLPLDLLTEVSREVCDPDDDGEDALLLREIREGGMEALAALFLISRPEVVLSRKPRMMRLGAPSPHLPVATGNQLSSAGLLCRDADGSFGVTAAFHATGPVGTQVQVGSWISRVKHASQLQDIVFIPLDQHLIPTASTIGRNGVATDREPARGDDVRFDGATNPNSQTRVFSVDTGILRKRPSVQLKIQTDPDTDRGDSGCALIDRDDRVLGFAFERTASGDYPQFTDWIWAANALRALNLTPY